MSPEALNQFIDSSILIKIAFLIFIAFNSIFLFVIYNQINSMDKVIKDARSSSILKLVALIALTFSISLFAIAVVIL